MKDTTENAEQMLLQTWHKFDSHDRLTKQVWSLGGDSYQESFTYDSDNAGRLSQKKVTPPNGQSSTITLGYDFLSRLSTVTSPALSTTYHYLYTAENGAPNHYTGLVSMLDLTPAASGSNLDAFKLGYTYDNVGNITYRTQGTVLCVAVTPDPLTREGSGPPGRDKNFPCFVILSEAEGSAFLPEPADL